MNNCLTFLSDERIFSAMLIKEMILPDGRVGYVYRQLFGTARLCVTKNRVTNDDEW